MKKLETLSQKKLAEVDRFVDLLRRRDREKLLLRAAMRSAEPAFARVWHDDSDAAYDRL